MKLPNAFRERGRARLQDVGRFDFLDVPSLHGADAIPTCPFHDGSPSHGLSAPRGDNRFRIPGHDLIGSHDTIACQFSKAQLGKDRLATCDFDEFVDPLNARNERVVPFLEEDARMAGKAGGGLANAIKARFKLLYQPLPPAPAFEDLKPP